MPCDWTTDRKASVVGRIFCVLRFPSVVLLCMSTLDYSVDCCTLAISHTMDTRQTAGAITHKSRMHPSPISIGKSNINYVISRQRSIFRLAAGFAESHLISKIDSISSFYEGHLAGWRFGAARVCRAGTPKQKVLWM